MAIGHLFGREAMRKLRGVLHRCALHRNRMRHFVNNLSAYLMFEVLAFILICILILKNLIQHVSMSA